MLGAGPLEPGAAAAGRSSGWCGTPSTHQVSAPLAAPRLAGVVQSSRSVWTVVTIAASSSARYFRK